MLGESEPVPVYMIGDGDGYFGPQYMAAIWTGVLWIAIGETGWGLKSAMELTFDMMSMNVMTDVAMSSMIYAN